MHTNIDTMVSCEGLSRKRLQNHLMSYRRILRRWPSFGLWPCVLRNMFLILLIVTITHWFQLPCVKKSKQSNGEIHIENSQSPSTSASSRSQCQLMLLKGNQIVPLSLTMCSWRNTQKDYSWARDNDILKLLSIRKAWGRIVNSRPAWTTGCGPFLKGRKKDERSEERKGWVDRWRDGDRREEILVCAKNIENSDNAILGKLTLKLHRYYVIYILSEKRI